MSGEGVLQVAIGGKLGIHPLIDFVKDLLNTIGHVASKHLIRGTCSNKKDILLNKIKKQVGVAQWVIKLGHKKYMFISAQWILNFKLI